MNVPFFNYNLKVEKLYSMKFFEFLKILLPDCGMHALPVVKAYFLRSGTWPDTSLLHENILFTSHNY